jgi:hypothetical protein
MIGTGDRYHCPSWMSGAIPHRWSEARSTRGPMPDPALRTTVGGPCRPSVQGRRRQLVRGASASLHDEYVGGRAPSETVSSGSSLTLPTKTGVVAMTCRSSLPVTSIPARPGCAVPRRSDPDRSEHCAGGQQRRPGPGIPERVQARSRSGILGGCTPRLNGQACASFSTCSVKH